MTMDYDPPPELPTVAIDSREVMKRFDVPAGLDRDKVQEYVRTLAAAREYVLNAHPEPNQDSGELPRGITKPMLAAEEALGSDRARFLQPVINTAIDNLLAENNGVKRLAARAEVRVSEFIAQSRRAVLE